LEPEVRPLALSPLFPSPLDPSPFFAQPRAPSRAPRGPPHLDPSAPPGPEQMNPPPGARFMLGNLPRAGFPPPGQPPPGAGFELNLQFHPNQ